MPVIVIDVEKSKAPSKVQHSEDRTWTPYPLGRVVAPGAQSWEGLPNSKGMRW